MLLPDSSFSYMVIYLFIYFSCGSTFTAPSGTITSPNYPDNYDNNRECIWQIITSPGSSIELRIDVFDVEHHEQCKKKLLYLHEAALAGR